MEITLEKIELVKDRTGCSYKEAKEALEANDANVVDAIIAIEEKMDEYEFERKNMKEQSQLLIDRVKDAIKKGNVARIIIKKEDETILNLPLNAGLVGAVLAPVGIIAGTIAAIGTKCNIELIRTDGTIVDFSDSLTEGFDKAVEKGSVLWEEAKVRGIEAYDILRDKAENAYYKARYGMCDGNCECCEDFEECEAAVTECDVCEKDPSECEACLKEQMEEMKKELDEEK